MNKVICRTFECAADGNNGSLMLGVKRERDRERERCRWLMIIARFTRKVLCRNARLSVVNGHLNPIEIVVRWGRFYNV